MRRVERERDAAFRARTARRERFPAGELADFARELAGAMASDRSLAMETIAARHIDRALEHEPDRGIALTHVEYDLAGRKSPCGAACEALRRLDLARVEHRKQLTATGLDEAHWESS
jgi:hypothetical protein